jgi:hypothetical protein
MAIELNVQLGGSIRAVSFRHAKRGPGPSIQDGVAVIVELPTSDAADASQMIAALFDKDYKADLSATVLVAVSSGGRTLSREAEPRFAHLVAEELVKQVLNAGG